MEEEIVFKKLPSLIIICLIFTFFSLTSFPLISKGDPGLDHSNPFARLEVNNHLLKGVVILVPGTLNSVLPGSINHNNESINGANTNGPNLNGTNIYSANLNDGSVNNTNINARSNPYYSDNIINTIQKNGYEVLVIKKLSALGSFESNGAKVYQELSNWYRTNFPKRNVPITILGHSAGGFYSLYASYLNTRNVADKLPIKRVIAISTPFNGLKIADLIASFPIVGTIIRFTIDSFYSFFDLRGLYQLTTREIRRFLGQLRLDPELEIITIGSTQEEPRGYSQRRDARFLCVACNVIDSFISGSSDGMVSVSSAYATNARIYDYNGNLLPIKRWYRLHGYLDHFEQAMDSRLFSLIGTYNRKYIYYEQNRLYQNLFSNLE